MMMVNFKLPRRASAIVLAVSVLAVSVLFSVNSFAELRVIVEYEGPDYRILRVVELPSSKTAPISDHLKASSERVHAKSTTDVKLLWFDTDGALIRSSSIDDPRLTHAPLSQIGQSPTVVGLNVGAFMVTGPSESAVLEIHLPANAAIGLDEQISRMMLVR